MATYEITGPDGGKFQITAPDDASQDQVLAYAQSQFQGMTPMDQNPIARTISNIPGSAANFLTGIGRTVAHPLNTGMGLLDAAAGGLHNLLPQSVTSAIDTMAPSPNTQRAVNTANAVGRFYKNRYGGLSNIGETIQTDPIGFMADVSTVAGLGGGAMKLAGIPGAEVPLTVSRYTNPINLAAQGISTVASPIWKQVAGVTTGSGPEAIGQAMKGTKDYVDAMRGNVDEEQVLQNAQNAFQGLKDQRASVYRSQLQNLKNANVDLDITPIQAKARAWLDQYNIAVNPNGELNFSRSSLAPGSAGANEVESLYNTVMDWGTKEGDTSPFMLDILKRRLSDFSASERPSRAMATSLSNATKDMIVDSVPEYADMQAGYAKASDVINQIQKALSLGNSDMADTALRKLMVTVREDPMFRKSLIENLDQTGDKNVMAGISGLLNKNLTTKRFIPSLLGAGAGGAALLSHPGMAALVPLASPRVVGELSLMLGKFGRAVPQASTPVLFGYQAGRLPTDQTGDTNGPQ